MRESGMADRTAPDNLMMEVFAVFKDDKLSMICAKVTDKVGMRPYVRDITEDLRALLIEPKST